MLNSFITLPEAPAIAGLHFRHTCGAEDAEALHAVQYTSVAYDAGNAPQILNTIPSKANMAGWLETAVKEGRAGDWLVAQVEDHVVGYNEIMGWKEAASESDITWVYLNVGWVLPSFRGRGLATAMLRYAENEIRRRAATDHPGEKIEFAANADTCEKEAAALLLYEGYRVAFTRLDLVLDPAVRLPQVPLPEGLVVRPALPEHIPLISTSMDESYQHENTSVRTYTPEGNLALLRSPKHDLSLWQVAWDCASGVGEVAGQVLAVIENGRAEVFEVSVRPAWRRRGLARCLLLRSLNDLRARGMQDIWLCTLAEWPTRALDLYHSVGFHIVKESPRYRKPFIW